jgi:hypothetical protein
MLTLNQGKTLTPGDLGINVRDGEGRLVDPALISYTIFAVNEKEDRILASPPKLHPSRSTTGVFWATGIVPTSWMGLMNLVWYLKQYEGDVERQIVEEFEVVRIDPATTSFEAPSVLLAAKPGMSKVMVERIIAVRELLSDENPDRNYHFRPPTEGKVVAGFNERVGYIWNDRTIIRMLRLAIQMANTWNPMGLTNYTVENAPIAWAEAIAVGAAAKCLSKEGARWEADEFDYSLNGVSLSLHKAQEYQSLANDYSAEFKEWLPNLTANRPAVVGLRQQRWLLGALALSAVIPTLLGLNG